MLLINCIVYFYLINSTQYSPFVATYHCDLSKVKKIIESVHEISNNVVCVTSKASEQPAHTRSLIRAFANRLSIL